MMPKTSLPPGFRFHPTDVEIVGYYLKRKLMGKPFWCEAISEVELYKFSPWDLPDKSQLRSKDLEWYFFCPRDRKYPNGSRMNRATDKGFWKATGRDRSIIHNSRTIGMRKTLVFHEGKPPKGNRTDWVMYEYRLEDRELVDAGFSQDAHVLCKIFQKSGPGPKIGAQYGAPFNEEDWEDDATTNISFSLPCVSCPSPKSSHNQDLVFDPAHQHPMASSVAEVSPDPDFFYADGISLEELAEYLNISPPIENANCEAFKMPEPAILDMNVNEASVVHPEGIYNELEDLNAQAAISGNINYSGTAISEFLLHPTQSELGSDQYMELNDLFLMGPSESIMPNDLFAQLPSAEWPLFQNLSNMHDPASSFDRYDSTAMYGSFHYGPDIMSQQASLSIQDEDVSDLFLI